MRCEEAGPVRRAFNADFYRAGADTLAVLRRARSASALRWFVRLATHAPAVVRSRSLVAADAAWLRHGARFRTPSGRSVFLPGNLTAGAREIYCRNVYLRTGLTIPAGGWVVDLGANAGLFTLLATVEGAKAVAVEAQAGFAPEIAELTSKVNGVDMGRVRIEIAMAASDDPAVAQAGVLADDERWRTASHAAENRPESVSVPKLMARHGIDRIGLLKVDIEGAEFSVFHPGGDLSWLTQVDQIAMEVHPQFGDVWQLRETLLRYRFAAIVTDDDGRAVPEGSPLAAYLYGRRTDASGVGMEASVAR